MINLYIFKTINAYMPESQAYFEYFSKFSNYNVFFTHEIPKPGICDVLIIPYGFFPAFKFHNRDYILVAEYASLSTGRFKYFKDKLKKYFNCKADITTYLNVNVRNVMEYGCGVKVNRGMGYFKNKLKERKKIEYDVVYSGANRVGVEAAIKELADLGVVVCTLGNVDIVHKNIICKGNVTLDEVYEVYSKSKFGLNYTPDEYPYNVQDSTKSIEYIASGLRLISNRYKWIEDFERKMDVEFIYLDDVDIKGKINTVDVVCEPGGNIIDDLSWDKIISNSGLKQAIEKYVSERR